MRYKPLTFFAVLSASALLSAGALAQPDHAPAHGARAQGDSVQHERGRDAHDYRDDRQRERRYQQDAPRINEREVRRLLNRQDAPRRESLPLGIQKNLERGKSLPPGIAKRFDGQLARELPRYEGYEWKRVGADVVLVDAASRVVVDILRDALR